MNYESKSHLESYQEFYTWYITDNQDAEDNAPSDPDDAHKYWLYMAWLAGRKSVQAVHKQEPVAWSVTVGNKFSNCIEITHCKEDAIAQYKESTRGGFESIYTLHNLYSNPVDVEILHKENKALLMANMDLSNWFNALKTDYDGLVKENNELKEAAKLAIDALDLSQSLLERSTHYETILSTYTALKKVLED